MFSIFRMYVMNRSGIRSNAIILYYISIFYHVEYNKLIVCKINSQVTLTHSILNISSVEPCTA